jgi:D-psicose/D-tagatose/L-ribulose 3-epimerase
MYYSYWIDNWEATYSSFVPMVAEVGFDIFEVNSSRLLAAGSRELEKLKLSAEEKQIELTYCTALSKDSDISSENAGIRKYGIDLLKKNLRLIHDLGGRTLSGVIYGAWGQSLEGPLTSKSDHLNRSIESMTEVIKSAEELGICCNIEVINRYEQFMINTCQEALDYVYAVNSPNIKIHLDTYHMNIEEDCFEKAIVSAGKKLGHFHVGENNRRLPGKGHIPWDEVFRALQKIEYKGNIVIEPFIQHEGDVAKSIKLWRDLKKDEDLCQEARRSLAFIKEKLTNQGEMGFSHGKA